VILPISASKYLGLHSRIAPFTIGKLYFNVLLAERNSEGGGERERETQRKRETETERERPKKLYLL
jgi:hypothetical protein